jgi:hypothetical protein
VGFTHLPTWFQLAGSAIHQKAPRCYVKHLEEFSRAKALFGVTEESLGNLTALIRVRFKWMISI